MSNEPQGRARLKWVALLPIAIGAVIGALFAQRIRTHAFSAAAREAGIPSVMGIGGGGGIPIPQRDLAKLVETNGVALVADVQMAMTGEGEAAAMASQMGAIKAHTEVTSVSTDAIADERFAVPAGYTTK